MTGVFVKKYHVAILDENREFVSRMASALKSWYERKIVVQTYTDPKKMFEGINDCKARKCPFDLTVMSPNDYVEKAILNQTDPKMPVLLCKDINTLKTETSKLLL